MSTYGQCNGCGAPFGVFKKEHGCKNCRFSFCSKCLPNKVPISHLNNAKHAVCTRCYDILTKRITPSESEGKAAPPPDAYYKRMAEVDQAPPQPRPAGAHRQGEPGNAQYSNMAKPDRDIADRLNKLQVDDKRKNPIPTLSDLDSRLQKLKESDVGSSSTSAAASNTYNPPERRTQFEQADDLLSQIHDEVQLDKKHEERTDQLSDRLASINSGRNNDPNNLNKGSDDNPKVYNKNITELTSKNKTDQNDASGQNDLSGQNLDDVNRMIADMSREMETEAKAAVAGLEADKEIQERLAEIRRQQKTKGTKDGDNAMSSDEENESEVADDVLMEILERSKLDDQMEQDGVHMGGDRDADKGPTQMVTDPDELPWCCMCNEDASIRCVECDMDLYCAKCFKKCHRQSDMKDHKPSNYRPPTTS